MPTRRIIALVLLVLLIPTASILLAAPASAAHGIVFAQDPGSDEGVDSEGAESEDAQGKGQSDAEAEYGAGKGETEEGESAEAEEEGPPWTYQMARITLVLLVLMGIVIGVQYYRMVGSRQRGAH